MTMNNKIPKPKKTMPRLIRAEVVDLVLSKRIEWNEACLLALLENMNNNDRDCFPSNKFLASQMGLSDRRLRLMLEKLESLCLIEKRHGNRRQLVTRFRGSMSRERSD